MTMTQLCAFLTVFEEGSFSRAALKLESTQSALSHAVAELERELGARLLERGRFGARPTKTGEAVAAHARQVLVLEASMRQEASLERGALEGTLRIATFRSVASHILPKTIEKLACTYPGLSVRLLETDGSPAALEETLHDRRVDVAFFAVPPYPDGVVTWDLLRDPFCALLPRGHPLAGSAVSRLDLLEWPLILYDHDICSVVVDDYLKGVREGARPRRANYNVREDSTLANLVGQGLGISVVPELAFQDLPASVVRAPLEIPLERTIAVGILAGSLKFPVVRAFLDVLRVQFPESNLPPLGLGFANGSPALIEVGLKS